jgi:hypothetical protein
MQVLEDMDLFIPLHKEKKTDNNHVAAESQQKAPKVAAKKSQKKDPKKRGPKKNAPKMAGRNTPKKARKVTAENSQAEESEVESKSSESDDDTLESDDDTSDSDDDTLKSDDERSEFEERNSDRENENCKVKGRDTAGCSPPAHTKSTAHLSHFPTTNPFQEQKTSPLVLQRQPRPPCLLRMVVMLFTFIYI